MEQYPIILIPPALIGVQPQSSEPLNLVKPQLPVQPQPPKPLPPAPQPINIQKTLTTIGLGVGVSWLTISLIFSLDPQWAAVIGGVVFIISIIVLSIQLFSDLKAFPKSKKAHKEVLSRDSGTSSCSNKGAKSGQLGKPKG